jgi:hypothetical protein
MIRWGLLGGRWGPVPAEAFLALGGACLAAAVLLVVVSAGAPLAFVGWIEGGILGAAGATVLAVGLHRRRKPPPPAVVPRGLDEQLLP